MGWLSNIIGGREIGRLEELIISSPAPSLYLRLGLLLAEQGPVEKARDALSRGSARFPESEELKQAALRLKQNARGAEIDDLRAKIERFPNPTLYAKLAKTLLEDGEKAQAMSICQSALKAFPNYGGIYLVIAEIHQDSGHGAEALESLRKAVALDKYNYSALLLLAETLLNSGEKAEAEANLRRILEFAPGDERAMAMLKEMDKSQPAATAAPAAKMAKTAVLSAEKLAEAKQPAAQDGVKVKTAVLKGLSGIGQEQDEMSRALRSMLGVPGIEAGLLIDQFGLVVASAMREGLDEELAAALITNAYRAVSEGSASLGVGAFEEANVESESGSISMLARGETILAVLAGSAVKAGMLQMAVKNCSQQLDKAEGLN